LVQDAADYGLFMILMARDGWIILQLLLTTICTLLILYQ
jgi:hypothetical protein